MTRETTIQIINEANKREEFIDLYGRTPEEYFSEYSHKEPDIWIWVLNDLLLDIPTDN